MHLKFFLYCISLIAASKIHSIPSQAEIPKRKFDESQYQTLVLENGLKVLLMHNDTIQNDATMIAINVPVGQNNDPAEFPGLSHLIEHLVFHSGKPSLATFFRNLGMESNATTAVDSTTYSFFILNNYLSKTCEHIMSAFTQLETSQTIVEKALDEVDSEYYLKSFDSTARTKHLLKLVANPQSTFSKETTGNRKLLDKPNLVQQIKQLFAEYYVASKMTLVIKSSIPLADLQALIAKYFSQLPQSTGTPIPLPIHKFFDSDKLLIFESEKNYFCVFFSFPRKELSLFLFISHCLSLTENYSLISPKLSSTTFEICETERLLLVDLKYTSCTIEELMGKISVINAFVLSTIQALQKDPSPLYNYLLELHENNLQRKKEENIEEIAKRMSIVPVSELFVSEELSNYVLATSIDYKILTIYSKRNLRDYQIDPLLGIRYQITPLENLSAHPSILPTFPQPVSKDIAEKKQPRRFVATLRPETGKLSPKQRIISYLLSTVLPEKFLKRGIKIKIDVSLSGINLFLLIDSTSCNHPYLAFGSEKMIDWFIIARMRFNCLIDSCRSNDPVRLIGFISFLYRSVAPVPEIKSYNLCDDGYLGFVQRELYQFSPSISCFDSFDDESIQICDQFIEMFKGTQTTFPPIDVENFDRLVISSSSGYKVNFTSNVRSLFCKDLRTYCFAYLLEHFAKYLFFTIMRLQENIGYLAQVYMETDNNLVFFSFTLDSSYKDPIALESRIQRFLSDDWIVYLKQVPPENLDTGMNIVIKELEQMSKTALPNSFANPMLLVELMRQLSPENARDGLLELMGQISSQSFSIHLWSEHLNKFDMEDYNKMFPNKKIDII